MREHPASDPWLPTKTKTVAAVLAVLALAAHLAPPLARFRPFISGDHRSWRATFGLAPPVPFVRWLEQPPPPEWPATPVLDERPAHALARRGLEIASVLWARAGTTRRAFEPGRLAPSATVGTLIEGPAEAMASFFAALARTRAGQPGAVTRILHFGDSPVTGDLISGGARRRLQERFGDAGHGFVLAARPWVWYDHRGVELEAEGWDIRSPLLRNGLDGRYGLAGIGFVASTPRARTRVRTTRAGPGAAAGRFDVYFGQRPGGGTLLVQVDERQPEAVHTGTTDPGIAVHRAVVPDGPHDLVLAPAGDGPVVLYGVALEREVPGVVYDSLGANGATMHFLATLDAGDWQQALRLRNPHLVILNYGTNESGYGYLPLPAYAADIRTVVKRIREALPGVSLLIMTPMDRGTTNEYGEIVTLPSLAGIVATQRRVAAATGCALLDMFQAMGGAGTAGRWYRASPRLMTGDLTHPTGAGAELVSAILVEALDRGLAEHLAGNGPEQDSTVAPLPHVDEPGDGGPARD
ncbi:MAG TPA: GDSL-type esterase/lipase family protein [Thermoanaerobaculaceae bacterium]|nr:GDSL-type esterase/lipase family protein [Thermoanaerobaculaceae bacterium]HRS14942.1 GDSL-type esterase/lipase family protein [Thermoanaerobaculaceae bacterium]